MSWMEKLWGPYIAAGIRGFTRVYKRWLEPRTTVREDGKGGWTLKRESVAGLIAESSIKLGIKVQNRLWWHWLAAKKLTAAVLFLAGWLTGKKNVTRDDIDGTALAQLYDAADWLERATENITPYTLQNYNVLPLAYQGSMTIYLATPMSDEEKLYNLIADIMLKSEAAPGTNWGDVLSELADIYAPFNGEGHIGKIAKLVAPWAFNENPRDLFTKKQLLSREEMATRWTRPNAAMRVFGNAWNMTPGRLLWNPLVNELKDKEIFLTTDDGDFMRSFYLTMTRTPILNTVAARLLRVDVNGGFLRANRLWGAEYEAEKLDWILKADEAFEELKKSEKGFKIEVPEECPEYLRADYSNRIISRWNEWKAMDEPWQRKQVIKKMEGLRKATEEIGDQEVLRKVARYYSLKKE